MIRFKHYFLLMLLSLCSITSYAYDFEVDGLYYNLISAGDKTCELVGVSNKKTSVVIPESVVINGISLTVTKISVYAFKENVSIESVDLNHPSLNYIPNYFFDGCKNLKKVIIGSNITEIGSYAFRSCPVKELTIPKSVKEIGYNSFLNLDKFILEDTNDTINIDCEIWSKEVHYGRPIQRMRSCKLRVESIASFGPGIQTLQYGLLNYSTIETLEIPSNITIIEDGAFDDAEINNLIFLPSNDSIKIGYTKNYAVKKVVNSSTSTIGAHSHTTVRTDEDRYYDYYGLLKNLCLKTLRIGRPLDFPVGAKTTYVANRGTETRETSAYTYITTGNNYTRYVSDGPFDAQKMDKVEINDKFTEIQSYLFYNTTILALSMPESCRVIGDYSFANSTIGKMNLKHVSEIGKGAFASSNINECCFPCSPFIVGENAFEGCNELQSIDLSYAENVGNASFRGCENLKEVVIGENLKELSNSLFANCSSLKSIYCKSSIPPTVGDGAFEGVNKFSCEIIVPKGCKSAYQNALGWNEFLFIYEYNIISKQPTADNLSVELDTPDDNAKYQWYQSTETKVSSKTITPTSSGAYVWLEENGIWTSGNKGVNSSSAKMYTSIDVMAGDTLSFDWKVSSESGYDYFICNINGSQELVKSGAGSGTYEKVFTSASTVSLEFMYSKDSSASSGSDCATVSKLCLKRNGFVEMVDSEIEGATSSVLNRSLLSKSCEVYCVVTLSNGRTLISDRIPVNNATATAINNIVSDTSNGYVVHTLNGVCLMKTINKSELSNLPKGIYIVNGRKTIVK